MAGAQVTLARGESRRGLLEDEGEEGSQGGETGGHDADGELDKVPDCVCVLAVGGERGSVGRGLGGRDRVADTYKLKSGVEKKVERRISLTKAAAQALEGS